MSVPKRVAFLAAWVAYLEDIPSSDIFKTWEADLKEVQDMVKTSDGAYRLSQTMLQMGVEPDEIDGLIERSK